MKRSSPVALICFVGACFAAVFIATNASKEASSSEINVIESIVAVGADIEIRIQSSRLFPPRTQAPKLLVGYQTFLNGTYPANGDPAKLVFLISTAEWDQTSNGDEVRVHYGHGETPEDRWDFGVLDKSLLSN